MRRWEVWLALAMAVPVLGCGGPSGVSGSADGDEPASPTSGVVAPGTEGSDATANGWRFVHAAASLPALDVWVPGASSALVTGVRFGEASGDIPPNGATSLELRRAGSPRSAAVLASLRVTPVGERHLLVLAGNAETTDATQALRLLTVVERFGTPGYGQAQVRIVHAGYDVPPFGVDVGDDNPSRPEFPTMGRFSASAEGGQAIAAFERIQLGLVHDGTRVTSFTTPEVPAGETLLLVVTGARNVAPRNTGALHILPVQTAGTRPLIKQNPSVYVLNGVPEGEALDVGPVGGSRWVEGLPYGALSQPVQVAPGGYELAVAPRNAPSSACVPVRSAAFRAVGLRDLQAGERYLAVATGLTSGAGAQAMSLATWTESFAQDGAVRAQLVNGATVAPEFSVSVRARLGEYPVGSFGYRTATSGDGIALPAENLTVLLQPPGQQNSWYARFGWQPASGERSFLVAVGGYGIGLRPDGLSLLRVRTDGAKWTVAALPRLR